MEKNNSRLGGGSTLQKVSGFSEEERNSIMSEINEIVSANRIVMTQDRLQPPTTKEGLRVPLIINGGLLLVVLIVSVFGYLSFLGKQQTQIKESHQFYSAESQLVREIIRRSEEKLADKEKEFSELRERLSEVTTNLDTLEKETEQKLENRRQELYASLEKDFEKRRQQLEARQYSREEVERLLEEPRREAKRKIEAELAKLRASLNKEKEVETKKLVQLRSNLEGSLVSKEAELTGLKSKLKQNEVLLQKAQQEKNIQIAKLQERLRETEVKTGEFEQLQQSQQATQAATEQVLAVVLQGVSDLQSVNLNEAENNFTTAEEYLLKSSVGSLISSEQKDFYLRLITFLRTYRVLMDDLQQKDQNLKQAQTTVVQEVPAEIRNVTTQYEENLPRVEQLVSSATTKTSLDEAERTFLQPFSQAGTVFPRFSEVYQDIIKKQEIFAKLKVDKLAQSEGKKVEIAKKKEKDTVLKDVNSVLRFSIGDRKYRTQAKKLINNDPRYSSMYRLVTNLITRANKSVEKDRILLGFVIAVNGKEEIVAQNISHNSIKVGTGVEVYRVGVRGEVFITQGIVTRTDGSTMQVQLNKGATAGTVVNRYDVLYLKR